MVLYYLILLFLWTAKTFPDFIERKGIVPVII